MKSLFVFLLLAMFACGRIDVTPPANPSAATDSATGTGTGTATAGAPATTPPAATAVVVNNTINNTQNGAAPTTAPTASAHPGLVAKGDTQEMVKEVLGTPTSLAMCNSDQTGWWFQYYCVGFENGLVTSQYMVPANKLYLPSW